MDTHASKSTPSRRCCFTGRVESTEEHMKDDFSKNMFGTDEVTVTVEYSGDEDGVVNDVPDEDLLNDDNDPEKEIEEQEEELNEEEEKLLENVKWDEEA